MAKKYIYHYTKKPGRRTKFDGKNFLKKVEEYLASQKDEEEIIKNGRGTPVIRLKVKLPTIEGFARFLKVTKITLYNWEKIYPEVAEGLEMIKYEQLQRLINEGLSGNYNATIAKLILSANHGMDESINTNLSGEIAYTFDERQIDRIAERVLARSRGNGDTPGEEKSN